MSQIITVIVKMKARPGKGEELRAAIEPKHKELRDMAQAGGERYFAAYQDRDNPEEFVLIERWTSVDDFNRFGEEEMAAGLLDDVLQLMESPPRSQFLVELLVDTHD